MGRTFNTGVGMVAVVSKENASSVISALEAEGEKVYTIGKLIVRTVKENGCVLKNLQHWD
jgi:phosphoribosylamine--glycine ligase/phosphoribosylformylglycinamidine cyclo-ligase